VRYGLTDDLSCSIIDNNEGPRLTTTKPDTDLPLKGSKEPKLALLSKGHPPRGMTASVDFLLNNGIEFLLRHGIQSYKVQRKPAQRRAG
jgi:hypothetical protein